jgi:hypothetical protein
MEEHAYFVHASRRRAARSTSNAGEREAETAEKAEKSLTFPVSTCNHTPVSLSEVEQRNNRDAATFDCVTSA